MTATFDTLCRLDDLLNRAGIHPLTTWWSGLGQLPSFYSHPTAHTLVGRVGRGGAKSHTSVKVALNELINGDFHIPPGEVHYWAQVSENKTEAAERLRLWEAALSALGLRYERSGDAIAVPELRRGVRVLACQVGAVSGFRCFGYSADECAKWENADHSANPAREVCASLDAMTITHPEARKLIISSPWGKEDYHNELCERGNTGDQMVVQAPSWVANPSISREQCLAAARGDQRIFAREYEAIPQDATSAAFDVDAVDRAFRDLPARFEPCVPIGIIDWSSGRGDACTWGLLQWFYEPRPARYLTRRRVTMGIEFEEPVLDARGRKVPNPEWHPQTSRPLVYLSEVGGLEGQFWRTATSDQIVASMVKDVFTAGVQMVVGDQRSAEFLSVEFSRHGLRFVSIPWTNENKQKAVQTLREWLRDQRLVCAPHDKLRKELHGFSEKLNPSGFVTYGARQGGHDDFAALCMTGALAYLSNLLPTAKAGTSPYERLRNLPVMC